MFDTDMIIANIVEDDGIELLDKKAKGEKRPVDNNT